MNNSTIAHNLARGIRLSAVVALLTGLLAITQPVRATNYIVTTTANSGSGSLREAITLANNNASADIITFAIATNGIPIILAGPAGEDANASGDLDILDGGDLTIQGNGARYTIIDGGWLDRVFHVCPGGGCVNMVTLSGVMIRNGDADYGGGIYNHAGTTTVTGSTVSANTATWGGGIFNKTGGTTTVDGSTISANTATNSGGGIFNEAVLNVQNGSTIGGAGAGNTAESGGGIYNWGRTTVDGSTVSANAANNGGGILNAGTLNVQNGSTIGGAGAGNTADYGGGIFNWGRTTVDGSTVSANTATWGGGIYNYVGTLNVQNGSTIGGTEAGNTATTDGGGIYNQGTLNVLKGSTVSANTATSHGGGIHNQYSGTTTVDGSTVSANTATYGGGIINYDTLNVQNGSTIGGAGAGNTAILGGGIENFAGTTTVNGSTVSANTADAGGGGIFNSATLYVQNGSTIGGAGTGNAANKGGGINNSWVGTTTVDCSTVSANTATVWGGGILNYGGTTMVTRSRILNNTAGNGGGVFNDWDFAGATSVTGSCIVGNSTMSYFNNQPAQQIATGNWWGAAFGPNSPGADTVGGNVFYVGWLTEPILDCGFYVYLPLVFK